MPFGYKRNTRSHGRSRRKSGIGNKLRRRFLSKVSSRISRKARGLSRILKRYGKSSARLRGSSTRTGRPPLPRGFFRRHSSRRGSSSLSRKSDGPINASYKYRASYRRRFKISKSMKKSVALAQGHTIQDSDVTNGSWIGTNGIAQWQVMFVGTQVNTDEIQAVVEANMVGFGQADWNTTIGTKNRFKIHTKVLNHVESVTAFNSSTTKLNVAVYPLLPRRDITTNYDPATLIIRDRQGDLQLSGGSEMTFQDPRFTPFMCPELVACYKILKPRIFTVHGGGRFNLKVRHSYDIVNSTANDPSDLVGKKAIYRPILIKMWGQLGIVSDVAGTYVRNMPTNVVWKRNTFWQAHVAEENRLIYNDKNVTRNQAVGAPIAEQFIDQETLVVEQQNEIVPSSTA